MARGNRGRPKTHISARYGADVRKTIFIISNSQLLDLPTFDPTYHLYAHEKRMEMTPKYWMEVSPNSPYKKYGNPKYASKIMQDYRNFIKDYIEVMNKPQNIAINELLSQLTSMSYETGEEYSRREIEFGIAKNIYNSLKTAKERGEFLNNFVDYYLLKQYPLYLNFNNKNYNSFKRYVRDIIKEEFKTMHHARTSYKQIQSKVRQLAKNLHIQSAGRYK